MKATTIDSLQTHFKLSSAIRRLYLVPGLISLGLLTSCTSNALVVSQYENQNQCIGQQPMAEFVSLNQIKNSALTFSLSKPVTKQKSDNTEKQFWLVKVAMGVKPTAGYGLSLSSQQLSLFNQVATIELQWLAPSADSISAQVMTSPCIYLKLQKGDYDKVKIVDSTNQQRYLLDIPHSKKD